MDGRNSILTALPDGDGGQAPAVFNRLRQPAGDLWREFEERLVALGGQLLPVSVLPLLLARDGGVWIDDDVRQFLPKGGGAASVWDAELGVCLAEVAIAETGSLVVAAGPGRARLTSLAPPVNLILVRDDAIVATPEEAFARLPAATSVVITGTSRTADIEGVLVRGVHGPRELYVIRLGLP
jgi:hypothetical protein